MSSHIHITAPRVSRPVAFCKWSLKSNDFWWQFSSTESKQAVLVLYGHNWHSRCWPAGCVCVCGRENNRWAFVDRTFYIYFLILSSLVLLWAAVYECMTADCIFCVCLYVSLLYSENKSPSGTIKSKSNLNPPFGFKLKQEFCHHVWGSMPPNKLLFVTSCENIIY